MKPLSIPQNSAIPRRTFIKRVAGTALLFGVGASVSYAANGQCSGCTTVACSPQTACTPAAGTNVVGMTCYHISTPADVTSAGGCTDHTYVGSVNKSTYQSTAYWGWR